MRYSNILAGAAGLALAGFATSAEAQRTVHGSNAPEIYSMYGASISVGGGVVGFTDGTTRDATSVGGSWDARLVLGTREFIGIEAAYTGAAMNIDALGLDNDARLISSGAEVLARVNFLTEEWQPYVVAGIGWRRYSLSNNDSISASVNDDENLGEVPLGAGLAYRYKGLVLDARGTFRAAFNDELFVTRPGQDDAPLHSWEGQLTAGWEF